MRPKDIKKKKKKNIFFPKKVRITKHVKKKIEKAAPGQHFGKKWYPQND